MSQIASAAAIFIGCCSVMTLAWRSPVTATADTEDQRDDQAHLQRLAHHLDVLAAAQVPGADPDDERRRR